MTPLHGRARYGLEVTLIDSEGCRSGRISYASAVLLALCAFVPGAAVAATSTLVADVDYRADAGGAVDPSRTLDIYYPSVGKQSGNLVFFIHGGGWAIGDKSNKPTLAKAKLFNDLGYVFVSTNYRLSPHREKTAGPDRLKHPTHVNDVADAVAFLVKEQSSLNLDIEAIGLLGHSSGAHLAALVASNQSLLKRRGIEPSIIKGFVVLDTLALDVDALLKAEISPRARSIYENAFGSPEENEDGELWRSASPFTFADAADPPLLVVTQNRVASRVELAKRFITALEQPTATSLLTVNRSHRQINHDLGGMEDPAGITPRVVEFFDQVFASDNVVEVVGSS